MTSGIYFITNKEDGTIYVGSSKNCQLRWSQHKTELRKDRHCNQKLQSVWNKYGESIFTFSVIEECHADLLYIKEQEHLDLLQAQPGINLYNLSPIAKGSIMSDAAKIKMSQRLKGNTNTLGFRHSKETKDKMSIMRKGVKKSSHSIQNYKDAALKREAAKRELPPLPYEEPEWLKRWKNAQR